MFARLAWGKVKPGTWDQYERLYHDEVSVQACVRWQG